jgi:hypothetical protein
MARVELEGSIYEVRLLMEREGREGSSSPCPPFERDLRSGAAPHQDEDQRYGEGHERQSGYQY